MIEPAIEKTMEEMVAKIDAVLDAALPHDAAGIPLSGPCRALIESGGKRWRPLLLVLFADNAENSYAITPLVEFAHNASLIHDDIEDASESRRGLPCAHITWGVDTAINSGAYLYFEAAHCVQSTTAGLSAQTQNALYALYFSHLRDLHRGQAMDIAWHKSRDFFPSIEEYMTMVKLKTGTLASLAMNSGLVLLNTALGETQKKLTCCMLEIGAAFQILDDVKNLTTGNPGKKRGDDIIEGKKSYPVILHIQENPNDKLRITEFFLKARAEGIDSDAIEECIELLSMEKSEKNEKSAITKAKEKAQKMLRDNVETVLKLSSPYLSEKNVKLIEALFLGLLP